MNRNRHHPKMWRPEYPDFPPRRPEPTEEEWAEMDRKKREYLQERGVTKLPAGKAE